MKLAAKILRSIFIVAILSVAGFFAGLQISEWSSNFASSARSAEWVNLGIPPSGAKVVHIGQHGGFLIEGNNGVFYYCQWVGNNSSCRWQIQTASEADLGINDSDHLEWTDIPSPPGDVISEAAYAFSGGEVVLQSNYAVLDDGSVWLWEYSVSGMDQLGRGLSIIALGLISGLIIGVTVSIMLWNK